MGAPSEELSSVLWVILDLCPPVPNRQVPGTQIDFSDSTVQAPVLRSHSEPLAPRDIVDMHKAFHDFAIQRQEVIQ
jgi:hypothetical protein